MHATKGVAWKEVKNLHFHRLNYFTMSADYCKTKQNEAQIAFDCLKKLMAF